MLYLIKKEIFLMRIEASLFCVTGINCWAQKFPIPVKIPLNCFNSFNCSNQTGIEVSEFLFALDK